MKNVIIAGFAVTTVASLVGNALLYQRYSTNRPLVRVGSHVITKKQYQDAVDYQTQGTILKKMVLADIVSQAAAKQGVTPTDKEVDARIALIERTKPAMLQSVGQDAGKKAELRENLQTDMALDNLRMRGIRVTDAEVADFYNRNKKAFALPVQVRTTLVVAGNSVDAATAASLLKQNTPDDVIGRQPRLLVSGVNGFTPTFEGLPPAVSQNISRQVFGMKSGEVKTIPLGGQFLIVKAKKNDGAHVPPLLKGGNEEDILFYKQVEQYAKLQKAPGAAQEVALLYKDAHVSFEMDKYAAYFSDVQDAASRVSADKKTASRM